MIYVPGHLIIPSRGGGDTERSAEPGAWSPGILAGAPGQLHPTATLRGPGEGLAAARGLHRKC